MSRTPMSPVNQQSVFPEAEIVNLLGQKRRHPQELWIGAHNYLLCDHPVNGYIAILEQYGFLTGVTQIVISHAQFNGRLLNNLKPFSALEQLDLRKCAIRGPIDLRPLRVTHVALFNNVVTLPYPECAYLCLPPATIRRVGLYKENIPDAEVRRLRNQYPGLFLTVEKERRN